MAKVVVIGGGVGGLEASLYLSWKGVRPLLVTASEHYVSGPSRPLILSGEQNLDRIVRGYRRVREHADVIVDRPLSVDPDNRLVNLSDGRSIEYDYLIVATGIRYDYVAIPGSEASLNVYELGRLYDLRDAIWRIKEGRILVYAPKQPYRCAPAPLETAFTIDMVLRHRGVRDKVDILFVDANPKLQPPVIHDIWKERLEEVGIDFVTGTELLSMEGNKVILSGGEEKVDLPVVLPPNAGNSPLGPGFLEVRGPQDLRLKEYDDVFAVGDVAKLPFPKNSEVTSISARIAASQVLEDLGLGQRLRETYRFVGWAYAGNLSGELATESIRFQLEFTPEGPKGTKDPEPKRDYTEQKDRWEQALLQKLFGY
ncbi:MAG: NAD(P)/FAD-dependent oxidoreductase [Candidatus Diapherotrites archaeon]|nr:NAD(P)/FAD-dependent oxidoreductase [Candidatus Diapherotrites archaeon]